MDPLRRAKEINILNVPRVINIIFLSTIIFRIRKFTNANDKNSNDIIMLMLVEDTDLLNNPKTTTEARKIHSTLIKYCNNLAVLLMY